jgi:RNA polymerase sigma-B factor
MTTLTKPLRVTKPRVIATDAYPAEPTVPAPSHHGQQPTIVHRAASRRRPQPIDPLVTTEQLLRQRDALPQGHPDRARLRTRAIEANLPMAKRLARRYAGRGELFDDLAQAAAAALIKAVDGYDSSQSVPFDGYAVPSIVGALKRHFRDSTWAIRVPRSAQELSRQISTASDELSQQKRRAPTTTELANHLHVTTADLVHAIIAARAYRLASLDAPYPGTDSGALGDFTGDTDSRFARVDDHLSLRPLLAALAPRERRILAMRFYGDMSQTRIAAEVGLSQMHVSRLLRQSLARLRAGMAG